MTEKQVTEMLVKVSLFLLQKCCYFCLFFAGDMVYTNQDLDDDGAVFTHIENT